VAHACIPNCLGGRDWEDHGSRPAGVKISQDPHLNQYWAQWHVPIVPSYTGGWF
jgi:hypothetical protein